MSANVFEKIVSIVSKVVTILAYAMDVFFGDSNSSDSSEMKD